MSSPDTPPDRPAGFFKWWRMLPKEPLGEADQSTPKYRVLVEGIKGRTGVSIRYRAESDPEDSVLLFYPRELYKRRGHVYVDGKSYPAGKFQTLRVDRIVEATLVARTYWERKTYGRGVIPGAWGVFLDLLVAAFIIGLVIQGLRWLAGLRF